MVVEKGQIVFTPFEVKTVLSFKIYGISTANMAPPWSLKRQIYVQKITKNC
jgi:hypothetical protein